jgi:hypothetical protein
MTEESSKLKLTGKSTFPGWYKIMESHLYAKAWIKTTDIWDDNAEKQSQAYSFIMGTLSINIAGKTPNNRDPKKLLSYLKKEFGAGNKYDAEKEFKNLKMTAVKPEGFLSALDETENKVILAGGTVSQVDKFETLLNGLHQIFYGSWIRDTRIAYDSVAKTEDLYEKLREELKKFYSATPVEIRQPYEKRTALGTTKKAWEERHCTY